MTFHDVMRALARAGLTMRRGKGSHTVWSGKGGVHVTVPANHPGRRVPPNTIRNMARQLAGTAPVSW